ncbi:NUDIX hydrolase [Candidatus Woesearchaeota archaeon]|nr:MAG: NUDIX hydrolase [Candidatus Woesearchaeota archaeon]
MKYVNPAPTVDIIIVHEDKVCLIKRKIEPYKGYIAIPGGYVDYGDTVEKTAIKEAKEETGLDVELQEIIGVYSDPERNPKKHLITTVFVAKPKSFELKDNEEAEPFWEEISNVKSLNLAFDHNKIFNDFIKWRKNKKTFWSGKR